MEHQSDGVTQSPDVFLIKIPRHLTVILLRLPDRHKSGNIKEHHVNHYLTILNLVINEV